MPTLDRRGAKAGTFINQGGLGLDGRGAGRKLSRQRPAVVLADPHRKTAAPLTELAAFGAVLEKSGSSGAVRTAIPPHRNMEVHNEDRQRHDAQRRVGFEGCLDPRRG
jgi:hypothetical protein